MPDWFYRTVSQPVLFRLPGVTARAIALGIMGWLARLPLGAAVIDFMGHMRADQRLRCTHLGIEFPTAIGLGPGLDVHAIALPALGRFGVGFLEVGPVTLKGHVADQRLERRPDEEAIWLPDPPESLSLDAVAPRLAEASRLGLPLVARLGYRAGANAHQSADDCRRVINGLAPHVRFFSLLTLPLAVADGWSMEQWATHVQTIVDVGKAASRPVILCVPCDLEPARADPMIEAALSSGVAGLLVEGSVRAPTGGRLIGLPACALALARVRDLRQRHGSPLLLIASGGVHEPVDALLLRRAGADLVQVDSGLVYAGPGLPKRINEALLFEATHSASALSPLPGNEEATRPAAMSWFWTFLMGAGMMFGSVLAMVIAATRVVLPYDEAFLGMSRAELMQVNPRLLPFMAHDRVCLAGTMIAIGVMYVGLSLYGVRRGLH